MKKRRVVVTGMGLVCSLGDNRQQIISAIKNKKNGLTEITKIASINRLEKVSTKVFGEVDVDDLRFVFPDEIKTKDKTIKLAYLCAKEAILDSGIKNFEDENKNCALVFGSCNGKLLALEGLYQSFFLPLSQEGDTEGDTEGVSRQANDVFKECVDGIEDRETPSNSLLERGRTGEREGEREIFSEFCRDHYSNFDFLNREFKINGAKFVFVNGCSASSSAIGFAFDLIKNGEADVAIVGASDTLTESTIGGFHSLQALSKLGASPFSERIGLSLGDGAGCIVLESEEHARNRDAKIYAEILSYSFFGDAFHTTSPDETGEGLRETMDEAIKLANLKKEDIKVICAHGTGTLSNDSVETLAIQNCFKEHSQDLAVTSTKSFYGHTLGASGITQAIIMIDAMLADFVPPIVNFENERPECDLKYVKNEPVYLVYDKFVSNSLAFGGNNVSIVIGKYTRSLSGAEGCGSVGKNEEGFGYAQPPEMDSRLRGNDGEERGNDGEGERDEKIVITGFSAISPVLKNKDEFFEKINSGQKIEEYFKIKSKNSRIIEFDNFLISSQNPKLRKFKKKPRVSQLAIEATEQVLIDSGLTVFENRKIGIIFGICKGGMNVFETTYLDMLENGIEFYSAMNFPNAVLSAIAGNVSIALGLKGYNTTMWGLFSPFACINYASEILKSGRQDAIIIGGADQSSIYDQKMMLEPRYKNSFISEGASSIILETEKNAKARGAKIYAEICGINTNSFDFEYFETDTKKFKQAFEDCVDGTLKKAGISKQDIDLHINCNFGLPENFKEIFAGSVTSQDYFGTLESTTGLLNIGMAILKFSQDQNKKLKKILLSASTLNGINYSLILQNKY
jgi:3-oxoacyl-[acyl-carrier-protein] synthase II